LPLAVLWIVYSAMMVWLVRPGENFLVTVAPIDAALALTPTMVWPETDMV
jgi:hypothetical protein